MEDDCVCEYDSTWDAESDGDESVGESQTRRSCQDKNRSGWTLAVRAFIITNTRYSLTKSLQGVEYVDSDLVAFAPSQTLS